MHDRAVVVDDRRCDVDRLLLAEFLTEFDRVLRADLDAAAAGDAVVGVHRRFVVGSGQVRRCGIPCGTKGHAGIPRAVTDEQREPGAVDVRLLMDITEFFRSLEFFFGFRSRQAAGLTHADAALSIFTKVDAPFAFEVGGAFAAHDTEFAAFAGSDTDALTGPVEPVGDLFPVDLAGLVLDRLFDGDGTHERDAHVTAPGDLLLKVEDVVQECGSGLGVLVRPLLRHDGGFHGTGCEDRQLALVLFAGLVAVFEQTDVAEVIDHLRRVFDAHVFFRGQFRNGVSVPVFHLQCEVDLRVGELAVEEDVLPGILIRDRVEHVDVPDQFDEVFPGRLPFGFLPVGLQTFLLTIGEYVWCTEHKLPPKNIVKAITICRKYFIKQGAMYGRSPHVTQLTHCLNMIQYICNVSSNPLLIKGGSSICPNGLD